MARMTLRERQESLIEEFRKRKEIEKIFRKRWIARISSKIKQNISQGDKLKQNLQLKETYLQYKRAINLAKEYNQDLYHSCEEKIVIIREEVLQHLKERLKYTVNRIEKLFHAERYNYIKPLAKSYIDFLKEYEWLNVEGILNDFKYEVFEYWKETYPKLAELADKYYDKRQERTKRLRERKSDKYK